MLKKLLLVLAVFVLTAALSYAADVKIYHATFNLVGSKAVVGADIILEDETTDALEFKLPSDYRALSLYVDNEPVSPVVQDNILKIALDRNSRVKLSYVTEEFVDKSNFLINMKLDFNIESLVLKLVLPEGATLKKPIQEGDLTSGSIYPKPSQATTDGRSLIFKWLRENVQEGDEISVFAQVELKKSYVWMAVVLLIVVLGGSGAVVYLSRKRPKVKIETKVEKIVEKEDMVEKHLKEDEEQIVNVLKQREGSCEQGTLRIVTGFSKATLSRILKELEDRNVVYKEKRGKKNLVFLKK